jgi:alcohol dehydrogenase class IV
MSIIRAEESMSLIGHRSTLLVSGSIVYGTGTADELPKHVQQFGNRVVLVYGGRSFTESGIGTRILDILNRDGIEVHEFGGVVHDPDELLVGNAVSAVRDAAPNCIIGIGGGSVIDTAKAASIIATNGGEVRDYWEGKAFNKPSIPYIAVPTTSGTGAEVTKNAVITSHDRTFKRSIRSELMTPDIALVDPSLTLSVPPPVTADTGLDAFIQNFEAFTSKNAGPITDTLALKGIELAGRYLVRAYRNPDDLEAREGLSLTSLYGGITLLNAGLGLAHGLSHPIGIRFGVPHGRACALVMPKVIEYNYSARKQKYDEVGAILGCDGNCVDAFIRLLEDLEVQTGLANYGIRENDLPTIVAESKGGSRNYNPIPHSDETVEKLLRELL